MKKKEPRKIFIDASTGMVISSAEAAEKGK